MMVLSHNFVHILIYFLNLTYFDFDFTCFSTYQTNGLDFGNTILKIIGKWGTAFDNKMLLSYHKDFNSLHLFHDRVDIMKSTK